MSQKILMSVLIVLVLAMVPSAFAGKVELTTYYPAPFGEYRQLKATGANNTDNSFAPLQAGGSTGTGLVVTNLNRVGIGTTDPQGILDVQSTTSAFFPPRVTTAERDAIASVSVAESTKKGAVVYNTETNALETYDGNKNWKSGANDGTQLLAQPALVFNITNTAGDSWQTFNVTSYGVPASAKAVLVKAMCFENIISLKPYGSSLPGITSVGTFGSQVGCSARDDTDDVNTDTVKLSQSKFEAFTHWKQPPTSGAALWILGWIE